MNRQRGVSLISLLVGLLVSVIVIVGMLMIFRNTIQAVAPASESARSDGERVSGLLAAQIMLHDAGFGIDAGNLDDALVVVGSNAVFSGGALSGTVASLPASGAKAIVWGRGFDTSTPPDGVMDIFRCAGLLADANGSLWRLSSDDDCMASANWNTITWTRTPLIVESLLRADDPNDFVREITIEVEEEECRPFGIGTSLPAGNITVTLSYPVNVGGVSQPVSNTTCLVNFQP